MGTTQTQPVEKLVTTKRGLDLDTFGDVTLYKEVPAPDAPKTANEVLAHFGNDHAKFMAALHDILKAEAVKVARTDESGWLMIDDEGKQTSETFTGNLVPEEASPMVNNLVLSLAKNVFSYNEAKDAVGRQEAKSQARDFIRSNETMLAGLKANVAALTK